jgi:hypothetical protein
MAVGTVTYERLIAMTESRMTVGTRRSCHCEERSDEAISEFHIMIIKNPEIEVGARHAVPLRVLEEIAMV